MNPGVQANIIAIVLLILVMFSWGARTLEDGHLSPRSASGLLIAYVLTAGWTLSAPYDMRLDLGGVLLPLLLTVWVLVKMDSWSMRLQWVMGILTVTSVLIVLMTLVPLDPAFFPLDSVYLYPLAVVLVAVLSVRRPFFAVSISVVGMALAMLLEPLIHGREELRNVVIEGGDARDMIAYATVGVLLLHRPYQMSVRFLLGMVRHWFGRQEGGPEHV
ncbi:MAG: hypothetical protein ACXVOI_01125 [Tumebacillaceae bacterium]